MSSTVTTIGPLDHGRPMSLAEFDRAEGQPGYRYELGRGVVTVVDVPNPKHLGQVNALRRQLAAYDLAHPGRIHSVGGGGECKILIAGLETERRPDLAVYKTPPPVAENVWAAWVPVIVVEVVSPGSEDRDYVEKRQEYLDFGVKEFWIVDAQRQEMLVLRRSGKEWSERTVRPPKRYTTRLLPGLEVDCSSVFAAAMR